MTLEIALLAYYLDKALPVALTLLSITFYVLLACSVIVFACAVFFVFRSITGYQLALTSPPSQLQEYFERSFRYLSATRKRGAVKAAEKLSEAELTRQYIECSDINILNNNRKAYNVRRAKIFTIISVVLLAATLAPFVSYTYMHPSEGVQRVEIVSPSQ